MTKKRYARTRSAAPLAALLALAMLASGCGRGKPAGAGGQSNASLSSTDANANTDGGAIDPAKLEAEIARLEREAEKNPGDEDARAALSQAYLRRGNALRDAQKPREALLDYQRALRNDPDNVDAQKNIAEISPLVEGTPTAENGEPAPLPITPNVTDDDDDQNPAPAKTPKKQ